RWRLEGILADVGPSTSPGRGPRPLAARVAVAETRGLVATVAILGALALGSIAVVRGGEALRQRHRWAVAVARVDGRPHLACWRPRLGDGEEVSPVRGTPDGAVLRLGAERPVATAEVVLPGLRVPPGPIDLAAAL